MTNDPSLSPRTIERHKKCKKLRIVLENSDGKDIIRDRKGRRDSTTGSGDLPLKTDCHPRRRLRRHPHHHGRLRPHQTARAHRGQHHRPNAPPRPLPGAADSVIFQDGCSLAMCGRRASPPVGRPPSALILALTCRTTAPGCHPLARRWRTQPLLSARGHAAAILRRGHATAVPCASMSFPGTPSHAADRTEPRRIYSTFQSCHRNERAFFQFNLSEHCWDTVCGGREVSGWRSKSEAPAGFIM